MDAQPAPALGAEDYQMLAGLLTSPDASQRSQGQGLAQKLTADEQQQFFDFQQQAHKGRDATAQRADANMVSVGGVGIAPEDALIAGQAVRGVVKAAASGGVLAGAKTLIAEAAPTVKYELVRRSLETAGVPAPIAIPLAMVVAGYKKGGKAGDAGTVAPPTDPTAPHLDRSVPMRPSQMTEQQLAERLRYGRNTPPPPSELRGRVSAFVPGAAPTAAAAPVASAPVIEPVPAAAASTAPPGPSRDATLRVSEKPPPVAAGAPAAAPAQSAAKPVITAEQMTNYRKMINNGATQKDAADFIRTALAQGKTDAWITQMIDNVLALQNTSSMTRLKRVK